MACHFIGYAIVFAIVLGIGKDSVLLDNVDKQRLDRRMNRLVRLHCVM